MVILGLKCAEKVFQKYKVLKRSTNFQSHPMYIPKLTKRRILQKKTLSPQKASKSKKLLKRCHLDLHKKQMMNLKILIYQTFQTEFIIVMHKKSKLSQNSNSREKARPNFRVTCEKLGNLLWKCKMTMFCQTITTSNGVLMSKKQIKWLFPKAFSSLI